MKLQPVSKESAAQLSGWNMFLNRRLLAQFERATDPLEKSVAALMLGYAHGDAMDMAPIVDTFEINLTNVDDYARGVLRKAPSA